MKHTLIKVPNDLFKAETCDIADINPKSIITTLFCDSSGFGSPHEPALTKEQALYAMEQILNKHAKTNVYAAITDSGKFQVYVTVFKKGRK